MTAQTIIVYLLTGLICFLLATKAVHHNDKRQIKLIVVILSLVSGLRAYSVGIDTQNYVRIFENIAAGKFVYAYGVEESFKYICYVLMLVCKSPTWMFSVLALVTNGLIVYRLWECRDFADFKFSFICYYVVFYFMTMNICRQFVATAIVFWATRYIFSKKYWKFIVFVFLSALIHTSSLVGMIFLAFEVFYWKDLNSKQRVFIIFGVMITPVGVWGLFNAMSRYNDLFVSNNGSLGIMLLLKFFVFSLSLLITKKVIGGDGNDKELMTTRYRFKTVSTWYLTGIILTSLGYFFSFVDRIGIVFYLFEGIHIGKTIKNTRNISNRQCFIFIEMAILIYYFIASLLQGSQGAVPYLFVWQS